MKKIKIALASLVLAMGISITSVNATTGVDNYWSGLINDGASTAGSAIDQKIKLEFNSFLNDKLGLNTSPDGALALPDPDQFGTIGENTSIREYLQRVVNFVLSFLGLVAVIFIIYAGWLYIVDGGTDGQKDKAKKIIIYVVIGIIVILASYALVNTIIRSAPVGDADRGALSQASSEVPNQNDSVFF